MIGLSDKEAAKVAKRVSKEETSHSISGIEVKKGVLPVESSSKIVTNIVNAFAGPTNSIRRKLRKGSKITVNP